MACTMFGDGKAKEGDNTTGEPWSIQWETKAKWKAPALKTSGVNGFVGIALQDWYMNISLMSRSN